MARGSDAVSSPLPSPPQVLFIFLGVAAVTIPIGIVCLVYGLKVEGWGLAITPICCSVCFKHRLCS